jgi:hypothetical protein
MAKLTARVPITMALLAALALAGCSMRVSGYITDAETNEPVSTAGISLGPKYVHVDTAGHYSIKAARHTEEKLAVVAKGYEKAAVSIDSSKSRFPQVNVALTPKRTAALAPAPAPKAPHGGPGAKAAP